MSIPPSQVRSCPDVRSVNVQILHLGSLLEVGWTKPEGHVWCRLVRAESQHPKKEPDSLLTTASPAMACELRGNGQGVSCFGV